MPTTQIYLKAINPHKDLHWTAALGDAVVVAAAKDYEAACLKAHKYSPSCSSYREAMNTARECLDFFSSDLFYLYSDADSKHIVELLDKKIERKILEFDKKKKSRKTVAKA